MTGLLAGKCVMVTGAGSGIGRAAARIMAREGARLLLADIDLASAEETADLVRGAGGEAVAVVCDVAREAEVDAAVASAVRSYGRLDGAFNNAGFPEKPVGILGSTEGTFDRVLTVNVKGVWFCLRAQIRQMQRQGGTGAIVNTASTAGLRGAVMMPAYSAAKHAVIGMTKSVALELARTGLRVNAVCPGVVDTPMAQGVMEGDERVRRGFLAAQPGGRFGEPREIGEAAAWLLSDAASFVTGIAMPVDGGMTG